MHPLWLASWGKKLFVKVKMSIKDIKISESGKRLTRWHVDCDPLPDYVPNHALMCIRKVILAGGHMWNITWPAWTSPATKCAVSGCIVLMHQALKTRFWQLHKNVSISQRKQEIIYLHVVSGCQGPKGVCQCGINPQRALKTQLETFMVNKTQ